MDTIVIIRDTVATCVKKTVDICQPCVKEAETNWQDVTIVAIICITILILALIGICRYFRWKKFEREAIDNAANTKWEQDYKDRKLKIDADIENHKLSREESSRDHNQRRAEELQDRYQKRKEELEDREQKRKTDLERCELERKIDLEEKLIIYTENQMKEGNTTTDDKYITLLKELISNNKADDEKA
jgi:hypothetical protein